MQLTGNIEDLGLGEILQIVAFSRKSGTLRLASRKREGTIVFKDGLVIRATSSKIKEGVCDLLLKEGVITTGQLGKAREIQQNRGYSENLGTILIKDIQVPSKKVEEVASLLIEKIAHSLFLWVDGSFVFELGDFQEDSDFIRKDSLHYALESGLNAQFLSMEGSRLLDEYKREGGTPEEDIQGEEPPVAVVEAPPQVQEIVPPLPPLPAQAETENVLIIDDDPLTRGVLRNQLVGLGFKASAFGHADAILRKMEELWKKNEKPVIIADLFMPRMDGEGMLGGLELLAEIKKTSPDIPVIIISEHRDEKAEKEVKDLNAYACLIKPKKLQFKEDVIPSEVSSFIGELSRTLNQLTQRDQKAGEEKFLLQEYLKELEGGDSFLDTGAPEPRVEESKGLRILKEMLSELSRPLSTSEIVLLSLRFSSEIMNRAVVFAVKKDGIAGLGQFGIELQGESADRRVRKMKIAPDEPSILKEALEKKSAVVKRLDQVPGNNYIIRELGGFLPVESFAAPIVVQDRAVMILYGDNAPKGDRIGDTSSLEIFLAQASIALERTILEKKLSGLKE